MKLPHVRAVTFDAGNTLLAAEPAPPVIYARVLSELGRPVTPEEVGPVFAAVWAEAQLRTEPGKDRYAANPGGERAWWGEFVRQVLSRLGHNALCEEALARLYTEFTRPSVWRVFPGVRETLQALKERQVPLAVISNWDSRLPGILDGLGLSPFFDVIAVSSLEGMEKPAPEIFTRTLARLGTEPEATLHLGDSPREDYDGARHAGLVPVLLDRAGHFANNGFRRISHISQIMRFIGNDRGGSACSTP